jgi:hypothetical protein
MRAYEMTVRQKIIDDDEHKPASRRHGHNDKVYYGENPPDFLINLCKVTCIYEFEPWSSTTTTSTSPPRAAAWSAGK